MSPMTVTASIEVRANDVEDAPENGVLAAQAIIGDGPRRKVDGHGTGRAAELKLRIAVAGDRVRLIGRAVVLVYRGVGVGTDGRRGRGHRSSSSAGNAAVFVDTSRRDAGSRRGRG